MAEKSVVLCVTSSGQFVWWVWYEKTVKIKQKFKVGNSVFSDPPHTHTFGAMTFMNTGGVCRTKFCNVFYGRNGPRIEPFFCQGAYVASSCHFYTPRLWRVGCNSFDIVCVCVCVLPLSRLNGQTYRLEFQYVGQVEGYLGQVWR